MKQGLTPKHHNNPLEPRNLIERFIASLHVALVISCGERVGRIVLFFSLSHSTASDYLIYLGDLCESLQYVTCLACSLLRAAFALVWRWRTVSTGRTS